MKIALACFAFLVATVCYFVAAASIVGMVTKHFRGEVQGILEREGLTKTDMVTSLALYTLIGTIALCLGLAVLAKSRR